MILSTAHATARDAAARLPALQASFDLLVANPAPAAILFYTGTDPATGTLLAAVDLDAAVGSIDAATYRIDLAAPIEGQAFDDGVAGCARVLDAAGAVWGDCTVSDTAGAGEIKLADTSLVAGAFVRITSAHFQG
ncbi:hypothetical protein [Aromatoleum aromaticum]|uniref:hypothetical protein n=1 Tax=Aromatoleum aromaticum TaxID=551760 RepID=UPI0002E49EEF|nr:hypothetical protein [Aromatoleum aromaticum]